MYESVSDWRRGRNKQKQRGQTLSLSGPAEFSGSEENGPCCLDRQARLLTSRGGLGVLLRLVQIRVPK